MLLVSCAGSTPGAGEAPSYQVQKNPLIEYQEQAELVWGEDLTAAALAEVNVRAVAFNNCMALDGFDPIPLYILDEASSRPPGPEPQLPPAQPQTDPVTYTENYGYRLTERWELLYRAGFLDRQAYFFVLDGDPLVSGEPDQRESALQEAFLARRTGTASSWDSADSGPPPEDLRSTEFEHWVSIWGCDSYAYYVAGETGLAASSPLSDPLWMRLEEDSLTYAQQVELTPEIHSASVDWSHCMREQGYDFYTYHDATSAVEAHLASLRPWAGADAWGMPIQEPDTYAIDESALAEVYDFEFAVAVADATCELAHPYRSLITQLQFEFDQQLVADNREALDQWLADTLAVATGG